ncbi:hypothetical protein SAMN05444351_3084 [Geodermatophilus nigrescens]|uniref:Uncharacterized protein n=1 Tax=Geodermatophilus nigrescens TaxID=1070870 RepID=A0A1M5M9B4_9ACTN|nr:hypothetical protein SAMN05444351_3084 [Geodermatophilus nigrescens]
MRGCRVAASRCTAHLASHHRLLEPCRHPALGERHGPCPGPRPSLGWRSASSIDPARGPSSRHTLHGWQRVEGWAGERSGRRLTAGSHDSRRDLTRSSACEPYNPRAAVEGIERAAQRVAPRHLSVRALTVVPCPLATIQARLDGRFVAPNSGSGLRSGAPSGPSAVGVPRRVRTQLGLAAQHDSSDLPRRRRQYPVGPCRPGGDEASTAGRVWQPQQ